MKTQIAKQLFQDFCDGYKQRQLDFLLSLFTQNTNMWGSGLDEVRVGLAEVKTQLERDWSQSEASEIHIQSFTETEASNWAAAICQAKVTIDGQLHVFDNLRGTIVIEKEKDVWKIAHMHASFPDYRNAENHSFPTRQ